MPMQIPTKRGLKVVAAVAATVMLLCALLVGAIAGGVFYIIGQSRAAETARAFLRHNADLRADIGEVKDFGWLVTGNLRAFGAQGNATLGLKVVGERRTTNAEVWLVYRGDREWRVSGATYRNHEGRIASLFDPYAVPDDEELRRSASAENPSGQGDESEREAGAPEQGAAAASEGETRADDPRTDDARTDDPHTDTTRAGEARRNAARTRREAGRGEP